MRKSETHPTPKLETFERCIETLGQVDTSMSLVEPKKRGTEMVSIAFVGVGVEEEGDVRNELKNDAPKRRSCWIDGVPVENDTHEAESVRRLPHIAADMEHSSVSLKERPKNLSQFASFELSSRLLPVRLTCNMPTKISCMRIKSVPMSDEMVFRLGIILDVFGTRNS